MAAARSEKQNLEKVSSKRERDDIFSELLSHAAPVTGIIAKEKLAFSFRPENIENGRLFLRLQGPMLRDLIPGEHVTLTFGVPSGQYYLQTRIEVGRGNIYATSINENLMRAQRRRHFRAQIPKNMRIEFQLKSMNGKTMSQKFPLFDVSGSGMSVLVPLSPQTPHFHAGDMLQGVIQFKDQPPMILRCLVRHRMHGPEGFDKVGLEFQDLDTTQEQRLVLISLQIYRKSFPGLFSEEEKIE